MTSLFYLKLLTVKLLTVKVKKGFVVLICLIQFWKLIKERECIKSSCWANWNIHHWNLNNLKISNITGFEWFRRIKGWLQFSNLAQSGERNGKKKKVVCKVLGWKCIFVDLLSKGMVVLNHLFLNLCTLTKINTLQHWIL